MKLFTLLFIAITSIAHAQISAPEITLSAMTEVQGAKFVEHHLNSSETLLTDGTVAFVKEEMVKTGFPMGDFAIMWGIGGSATDQNMTKDEYTRIWRIMNYLADKGFRVVMNTKTRGSQLKEIVETEGVSVVIFSAHGNNTGFYDFNSTRIGYDLFTNKARSLYQFILSACYGSEARHYYAPPADMIMYTWSGLTNSSDLERHLMSDSWTGLEGRNLIER
ncbi:MAG: hypothetical protein ACLGG0_12480 [Bacteriovoracia bacterium]